MTKPALDSLSDSFDSLAKTAMRVKRERDDSLSTLKAVVAGYDYNPGDSDLDDEQPIHVSMTLGDYRRARMLVARMESQ